MKLETLSRSQASDLIDELRGMAELPPGTNRSALRRAKEIRFQVRGQVGTSPSAAAKAGEAYQDLEILLHAHRWKAELSLDYLRKRIKSSCERLRPHLGL
jgi:hypothetical protein